MKVALFSTCIGDAMFPDVAKATAVIISRLGHEVVFPKQQTCCGQMHVNTGYQREAIGQIENYVEAFADPSIDCVVAPSGSCTGAVREQHVHVASRYGTTALVDGARTAAKKTYDLSEFIIDVCGTDQLGAFFPHRVTYHSSCHSLRPLKIGDRPLQLLRNVESIDLVDLPHADECCGFGGTFSVKNAETSAAMVSDKCRNIKSTAAEYVTAGDASCLMNIGGALARQHAGVRAVHMAEILASTKEHPWTPTSAVYSKEFML
ncbi:(Fe-S)-binding protein [Corynebacterium choanae]|uniref:Lactate utilization protein A n=1 Tax=Corynebacterium choanae TaxID=1862358 RepID=A0A3G6JA13_9CORY|nr:(Fe-S)-binding protein [Corynebacterium choanae]AZA13300.1 Lactate utilization protein A [Corynebacterium choanae]